MADVGLSSPFDLSRRLNPAHASEATISERLRGTHRVWVLRQNTSLQPGGSGYLVLEEEQTALGAEGCTATYSGERTELILMAGR